MSIGTKTEKDMQSISNLIICLHSAEWRWFWLKQCGQVIEHSSLVYIASQWSHCLLLLIFSDFRKLGACWILSGLAFRTEVCFLLDRALSWKHQATYYACRRQALAGREDEGSMLKRWKYGKFREVLCNLQPVWIEHRPLCLVSI